MLKGFSRLLRGKAPARMKLRKQNTPRFLCGTEIMDEFAWIEKESESALADMVRPEMAFTDNYLSRFRVWQEGYSQRCRQYEPQVAALSSERVGPYIYYRRPSSLIRVKASDPDEVDVVLDFSQKGPSLLNKMVLSHDHKYLAYTLDHSGAENFELHVIDIESGEPVCDPIPDVYNVVFAKESSTVLYTLLDNSFRPSRAYAHKLVSTGHETPQLLFSEKDDAFYVDVGISKDHEILTLSSCSKVTSEVRTMPSDLSGSFRVIEPRTPGLEYFVEHRKGHFYIFNNADQDAQNFQVSYAHMENASRSQWRTLIPAQPYGKIEDIDLFRNHLILYERKDGFPVLRVVTLSSTESDGEPKIISDRLVDLPYKIGMVSPGSNLDTDAHCVNFNMESPLHSAQEFTYDFATGDMVVKKADMVTTSPGLRESEGSEPLRETLDAGSSAEAAQPVADAPTQPDVSADQSGEEVVDADASAARVEAKVSSPNDSTLPLAAPLNFTSSHVCERHLVTTMDKAKVPLTIIRRKDTMLDGSAPLLLRVYGAYGDILHAKYEADRMPLMDEGWIFALAHVRGGSELGHFHHENGRLMHKKNTFSDFIACAEWLIQNKYCSAGRIVARSHSAGGLAVGAALNLKPQLFAGAIMNVPFVDVLTTMSDPALPLSVHERDEWGDINNEEVFKYVASYCPYHNIPVGHHYPSVFVSAALEDRRVPPWVPIKYFCRIRDRRRAPTTSPGSSNSNTTMHLDSSAAVTDNADVTDMDPPDLLYVHEHGGHFSDSLLPAKIAAEMAYAKACVGQFDEEQEN